MCVLDAAVLLRADWDRRCHEVWASIIPPQEVGASWIFAQDKNSFLV